MPILPGTDDHITTTRRPNHTHSKHTTIQDEVPHTSKHAYIYPWTFSPRLHAPYPYPLSPLDHDRPFSIHVHAPVHGTGSYLYTTPYKQLL